MCCSHSLFIPEFCFFAFHRYEPQTEENVDDRDDPIARSKSRGVDHVAAAKVEAAVISYCLILNDAGRFHILYSDMHTAAPAIIQGFASRTSKASIWWCVFDRISNG